MNKRRGFYSITAKYEVYEGVDENNGKDKFKEVEKVIRGHFSTNFWVLIQEHIKGQSMGDVFNYFATGFDLAKTRELLYFSHIAYCQETSMDNQKLASLVEAGQVIDGDNDFMVDVFEAFMQSKVVSGLNQNAEEEQGENKAGK